VLELDDLFTDPVLMRRGAARALIEHAVSRAAANGVHRIDVTANPHALDFYRGRIRQRRANEYRVRIRRANAP